MSYQFGNVTNLIKTFSALHSIFIKSGRKTLHMCCIQNALLILSRDFSIKTQFYVNKLLCLFSVCIREEHDH